jgi:hypothetical protein
MSRFIGFLDRSPTVWSIERDEAGSGVAVFVARQRTKWLVGCGFLGRWRTATSNRDGRFVWSNW